MQKLFKKNPHEVSKMRIAFLTDRILASEHKPLLFGIMFNVQGLNVTPLPIRNKKNVDKRRRAFGIKTTVEQRRKALIRERRRLGAR